MKFCLINNLYPPYSRGGTEKIVDLISDGFKKTDEVLIITSKPDGDLEYSKTGNLQICRINPNNYYYILDDYKQNTFKKIAWHLKDLFSKKVSKKIEEILLNQKVDLVFTHNLKGLSLRVFKTIRKLNIPHIHTLHDYQLLDPHGSMHRLGQNLAQKGLFYRFYRYLTAKYIKSPNLVISPSKFVLNKHLEYGFFENSKKIALANPIQINNLENKKKPSNKLRLLYLGQIESHKGIEFLVKSFSDFKKGESELNIVGDGSLLEKIKAQSKNDSRINVLGKIPHENLKELFKKTDLLVVPSIWWENSPTVIYEAYNFKTPVLVSDSGGSKELVIDGETGWIFEADNKKSFLVKLNLALNFKSKLPEMGEESFKHVQQYSQDRYIKKLLELCQNLKK